MYLKSYSVELLNEKNRIEKTDGNRRVISFITKAKIREIPTVITINVARMGSATLRCSKKFDNENSFKLVKPKKKVWYITGVKSKQNTARAMNKNTFSLLILDLIITKGRIKRIGANSYFM